MSIDRNLLEEMLSKENLNKAVQQVIKNKGASGVDGMETKDLMKYFEKHGEEIKEQIRTRRYKPSPVKRVEIPKPEGGIRNLGIPTVLERCIQQAINKYLHLFMSQCSVIVVMDLDQTAVVRWQS